jgi:hypothetical protein
VGPIRVDQGGRICGQGPTLQRAGRSRGWARRPRALGTMLGLRRLRAAAAWADGMIGSSPQSAHDR